MDITYEAEKLNKIIRESKEYNQYVYTRNALKSHEELYSRYVEFKRRNNSIQNYGSENIYDDMMQLAYENDELIHNTLVSDFIGAENKLQMLMQNVLKRLMEGIEFDNLD